jgi:hypothetical protein
MRRPWMSAAIIVAALVALSVQTGVVARAGFLMGDFRAFYCAASVAAHGGNPYHTQPLRACEVSIVSKAFLEKNPNVTIPAPLPSYAIAALIPFSVLPFAVAAGLWAMLLLCGCVVCVAATARVARVSWETALAVFALPLVMLSLPFGEVVPAALALICAGALFASKGLWRYAALCAAGAMIEPHLGLPVCLALVLWVPRARLTLALALALMGALSLVAVGPAANVEYFSTVLPAHALSEITRDTQYSLSAVLAAVGVAQPLAVRIGALEYLAMLVLGVAVAQRLARTTGNAAFLVVTPPAFAVFGGTFIHVTQIAVALPCALLFGTVAARRERIVAFIALLLLAVPWAWAISPALLVAPFVPIGYMVWRYWSAPRFALVAALAGVGVIFGLSQLAAYAPHVPVHAVQPALSPVLPEASWRTFTEKASTNSAAAWIARLPTWIGLILLLALMVRRALAVRWNARNAALVALALVATVAPIAAQAVGDRSGGWLMVDFRAYYCAALAQRADANPYFTQPLHACEAATPAPYFRAPAHVTVPAPYPPYALALLAPLTSLPFPTAALIWWILLAGAIACAAYAVARLCRQPAIVGWAAFALSLGLAAWPAGNMLPIAVAGVALAGLAVARQDTALAIVAIALTALEPHVAVPAAMGLFVAMPAIRLALALGGAFFIAVSLTVTSAAQVIYYLTAVVPAHALSEVSRDNQLSLATIVAALGVPDSAAVLIGGACYAVMIAIGLILGARLARRYDQPAFTVLLPPACALVGGSFVHTVEIAAAVPAALLLFTHANAYKAWFVAALVLLAIPWMFATSITLFLAPLFPAAYLTYALWNRDRARALGVAAACFALILTLFAMSTAPAAHHAVALPHAHPPIDPRLAESAWRDLVLGNSTNRPVMWLLRLPTWIGLLALVVPAALLARRRGVTFASESLVAT